MDSSLFQVPKMDCAAEESLVRMQLGLGSKLVDTAETEEAAPENAQQRRLL